MEDIWKNKLLLDKNIVLDIILARKNFEESLNVISQFTQNFITTNTFVTCFYILRKSGMSKDLIYSYLKDFEIIVIKPNDCHLAYNLATHSDDIEDCLELFTAKRNKCAFLTSDQKLISKYGKGFKTVVV